MTLETRDNMDVENIDTPGRLKLSNTFTLTSSSSSPVRPVLPSGLLPQDKNPEKPAQQQHRMSTFLIDDILKPTFGSQSPVPDSCGNDVAKNELDFSKIVNNEYRNNCQESRVPQIGFSVVSILQQRNTSKSRTIYGRHFKCPDSPIRHPEPPENTVPNVILPTAHLARNIAMCNLQSENSHFTTSAYQHLLQQQLRQFHQRQLQDIYKHTSQITSHVHQTQHVTPKTPKQQTVVYKSPPNGYQFSNPILSPTSNTPPRSPDKFEEECEDKNKKSKYNGDPASEVDASNPAMWPAWVYCTRYSDRPSSGPRSRKMKQKETSPEDKRPRTAFTNNQLGKLRQEFEDNKYLTEERRQRLARELDLTDAQVKIWFQNKRAKMKKAIGSRNPLAMQLMAQGLYNHATFPTNGSDSEERDISAEL